MKLTAIEIRLLSKIIGNTIERLPGYFLEYQPKSIVKKLLKEGYLANADISYNLSKCTTVELKQILERYQLSTLGKKAVLVDRIINNIPASKLPNTPTYYIATELGEQIINKNKALLLYFNSSLHNLFDVLDFDVLSSIIHMQDEFPELSGEEILKQVVEEIVLEMYDKDTSAGDLYLATQQLQLIYKWLKDDIMIDRLEMRLSALRNHYITEQQNLNAERDRKISELSQMSAETITNIKTKVHDKLKEEALSDTMNDEEFDKFVNEQCNRLSDELSKSEFRRIAYEKKKNYSDEIMSLREYLMHNADSMLIAEKYYKKHKK